jgi:uncharacterized protein (TIGR03083 family)
LLSGRRVRVGGNNRAPLIRSVHVTSLADRTISALRSNHDELIGVVAGLSDEQLDARSGATEWSVAQVLSHLGSGAEISRATLAAAVGAAPNADSNQDVWNRWNALTPRDQAAGFVSADDQLISLFETLDAAQRASLSIDVEFLPAPMTLAAYAGMRLNEAAQHSWDARVSLEPDAIISADTADLLAEHFATDLAFLLGFTAKTDALAQSAVIAIQGRDYVLDISDRVSLINASPPPTATFTGSIESLIRMFAGRLTNTHTPPQTAVEGNVTLDDLRRVFPGY